MMGDFLSFHSIRNMIIGMQESVFSCLPDLHECSVMKIRLLYKCMSHLFLFHTVSRFHGSICSLKLNAFTNIFP